MKLTKKNALWITFSALLIISAAVRGYYQYKKNKGDPNQAPIVRWEQLYELNYETGDAPATLKAHNNTVVRVPGYIVPLSDDYTSLSEFLLVPNPQACIHVPAPPPNLIVYVKLAKPVPMEQVSNPSWAQGVLKIQKTESQYGAAGYFMENATISEFKGKDY